MKFTRLAACLLATTFASAFSANAALATTLPDTPVPFKLGAGAINDGVIYVGLGTFGQDWYKINVNDSNPQWQKIAQFPAAPRDQAQAVALNGKIYVFGGAGKLDGKLTSVSNEVFCYDPQTDKWEKVLTRSPFGLTGHTVVTVDGKNAILIGSVNKAIFDGFFSDLDYASNDKALSDKINADYIGKKVEDYFFNKEILQYNAQDNLWTTLGENPYFGTAGSAVAVGKDGTVYVVGGEKKPGLRTDTAFKFKVDNGSAKVSGLPQQVAPKGQKVQEGVAGAFSGVLNDAFVVIGGANFPGSTANYDKGIYFAHNGCTKTWRDEIYTLVDGKWTHAGKLQQPLGYGVSIQNGDELLLIGGETTNGTPTSKVQTITYENGKVIVK